MSVASETVAPKPVTMINVGGLFRRFLVCVLVVAALGLLVMPNAAFATGSILPKFFGVGLFAGFALILSR